MVKAATGDRFSKSHYSPPRLPLSPLADSPRRNLYTHLPAFAEKPNIFKRIMGKE